MRRAQTRLAASVFCRYLHGRWLHGIRRSPVQPSASALLHVTAVIPTLPTLTATLYAFNDCVHFAHEVVDLPDIACLFVGVCPHRPALPLRPPSVPTDALEEALEGALRVQLAATRASLLANQVGVA